MVRFGHSFEEEEDDDAMDYTNTYDSSEYDQINTCGNIVSYQDSNSSRDPDELSYNNYNDSMESHPYVTTPSPWTDGIRFRSRNPNYNNSSHETYHNNHNLYHGSGLSSHNNHQESREMYVSHPNNNSPYPYDHPQYQEQNQSKSSPSWMRRTLFVIVSFFLLRHYDELSLPLVNVSMFTQQLCTTIYDLAKDDANSLLHQLHTKINSLSDRYYEHTATTDTDYKKCVLTVPNTLPKSLSSVILPELKAMSHLSATETWLLNGIVGQNKPMTRIAQALDGWILHDGNVPNNHKSNDNDSMSKEKTAAAIVNDASGMDKYQSSMKPVRPISLLLTGPDGVGKSETAFLLSRLLFADCDLPMSSSLQQNDALSSHFHKNDSVLILHGEDYITKSTTGDVEDTPVGGYDIHDNDFNKIDYPPPQPSSSTLESPRELLRNTIVHHIHSQRYKTTGSVIILTGIEQINDATTLDVFSEILNSPSGATLSLTPTASDDELSSLTVSLDRLLIIFTTDLGTDQLFRLIQQTEGNENQIPNIQLSSLVKNALDWHWEGRLKLIKHLDAIVPFLPLRHSDLVEIMRRKVYALSQQYAGQSWKRLFVSESTLRHLVGTDFIEYLDLRTTENSTKNSLLVFSKYGAHIIENGGPMHVIRAKLRRYLHPHRANEVAFFDFDKDEKVGMLKWCKEDDDKSGDFLNDFNPSTCEEIWRGFLE